MRNSILNITCITVLQFTEWLRLNRTSVDHLVHSGCLSRDSSNRLLRAASSHVLSKTKDGDSTSSLCNLVHCLIILSVKKKKKKVFLVFFLCLDRVLCVSICAYCPSLDTAEKSLASSSFSFPVKYLHTLIWSPWAFSFPGWRVPSLSDFLSQERLREMLQSFIHFSGTSLDLLQ